MFVPAGESETTQIYGIRGKWAEPAQCWQRSVAWAHLVTLGPLRISPATGFHYDSSKPCFLEPAGKVEKTKVSALEKNR